MYTVQSTNFFVNWIFILCTVFFGITTGLCITQFDVLHSISFGFQEIQATEIAGVVTSFGV